MNYRHAFHAGNFADVLKHLVFARMLVHLREKPAPFRVVDTHAGAGRYVLASDVAQRTGEWRAGIGRLLPAAIPAPVASLLAPYREAVLALNPGYIAEGGHPPVYPGSPLVALHLMRAQDRLVACELEPGAAAALAAELHRERRAKAIAIDGYVALNAYLPPRERRGVVLIDPPFEQSDEFERLAHAIVKAWRKWQTGMFLVWFPIKDRAAVTAFCRALKAGLTTKMLQVELDIDAPHSGLAATGLVVVNPPWRLADELAVMLPWLAQMLAQGPNFRGRTAWLRNES